jgi:ABC-2 type transport system ATP-binding protein
VRGAPGPGGIARRGSLAELIAAAQGKVWQITAANGAKPNGGLTVVSTLHMAEGVEYRVVGAEVGDYPSARALQPSLEDGYVWLMRQGERAGRLAGVA